MAAELVIYTHPDCEYSNALKLEMQELGVEFEEIDLAVRPDEWARVEELTEGRRVTPVSVEGELVTVGFHGVG